MENGTCRRRHPVVCVIVVSCFVVCVFIANIVYVL